MKLDRCRCPALPWSHENVSPLFAMTDMLVRLYALPDAHAACAALAEQGILVRPCRPFERHIVADWIGRCFSARWVDEFKIAMGHQPTGCLIATRDRKVIGFVCCDATARGFIGPMGVDPQARQGGIGRALLLSAAEQMKNLGYAYAIIGGVGPKDFYQKCVGAVEIEGSDPGIYADILPSLPSN